MTLEDLVAQIYAQRLVLAYSQDGSAHLAWRYPYLSITVRRAIHNRRRGLAQLMLSGDWRLCPDPDLHRQEYYYAGQGRYVCAICRRIDAAQLGLWKVG